MAHTCQRCNTTIPDGGLFYFVKLSAVSGYDGIIDPTQGADESRILGNVAGTSPEDLEKDVHLESEAILCYACRTAVIDVFCREVGTRGESDTTSNNLLH